MVFIYFAVGPFHKKTKDEKNQDSNYENYKPNKPNTQDGKSSLFKSRSSQCSTTGVKTGRGMCYPVCGMIHIKEPLLLFAKSNPCGGSGFPLLLSKWSFTIKP